MYLNRKLFEKLSQTIKTRPLVYLSGPRQVGKSTLARNIGIDANYVSFDTVSALLTAKSDPAGFLKSLPQAKLNILDEVWLAPSLFRYLKIHIDEGRINGNDTGLYLLTGSANLFALPKLSDALVGRTSVLTLLPFSTAEYKQTNINFIEELYNKELSYKKYGDYNLVEAITRATYPEIALDKEIDQSQWYDDYITTTLQRDVQTLANIRMPEKILQLLSLFSMRVGSLLNNASIIKEAFDAVTYNRYKAAIINTFLIFEIKSWTKPNHLNKKFIKATKVYFYDTNLLCHIMRRDIKDIYSNDRENMGHVFENFIATEIMKNVASYEKIEVSHFNPIKGKEVDFVLEKKNGNTIGIEVKLGAILSDKDFTNMQILKKVIGDKFKKGIVIYAGNELVRWKDNIWAVPVCYLWN
jgi:predicted AAA+ superfamily ATPase